MSGRSAAFASGRPRLRALAASERDLLQVRAALEALVGPVPQADTIEPFDPTDSGEPWELRVDLPAASADVADGLPALSADVTWSVADSPGLTEALDRGWLVPDVRELGGVTLRWLVEVTRERRPDLERPAAADPLVELVRGIKGVRTADPVVHRPSGRWGVELTAADDAALDPLAAVLRPGAPFATDGEWEWSLGAFVVRVWAAGPLAASLPGDGILAPDGPLDWLADLPALFEDAEVQVATGARDHDAVVEAVTRIAARAGWHGGRPRWVRTPDGPLFAPVWRAAADAVPDRLAAIREVPGVLGVRVVPGEPSGLPVHWPVIDPAWRTVAGRCFVRLADPLPDRDAFEWIGDRVPDARDHALADAVPFDVRPIADRRGRRGLEVQGGRASLAEDGLRDVLAAAGAARHPDLLGVATFGFERAGVRVRLWYRDPVEPGPRIWRDHREDGGYFS